MLPLSISCRGYISKKQNKTKPKPCRPRKIPMMRDRSSAKSNQAIARRRTNGQWACHPLKNWHWRRGTASGRRSNLAIRRTHGMRCSFTILRISSIDTSMSLRLGEDSPSNAAASATNHSLNWIDVQYSLSIIIICQQHSYILTCIKMTPLNHWPSSESCRRPLSWLCLC